MSAYKQITVDCKYSKCCLPSKLITFTREPSRKHFEQFEASSFVRWHQLSIKPSRPKLKYWFSKLFSLVIQVLNTTRNSSVYFCCEVEGKQISFHSDASETLVLQLFIENSENSEILSLSRSLEKEAFRNVCENTFVSRSFNWREGGNNRLESRRFDVFLFIFISLPLRFFGICQYIDRQFKK